MWGGRGGGRGSVCSAFLCSKAGRKEERKEESGAAWISEAFWCFGLSGSVLQERSSSSSFFFRGEAPGFRTRSYHLIITLLYHCHVMSRKIPLAKRAQWCFWVNLISGNVWSPLFVMKLGRRFPPHTHTQKKFTIVVTRKILHSDFWVGWLLSSSHFSFFLRGISCISSPMPPRLFIHLLSAKSRLDETSDGTNSRDCLKQMNSIGSGEIRALPH